MSQYKRYLVTSALPYANGPLHVGHIAGAYIPADIYVRFLRMLGKDVVFVCGSDEHGAAITMRARKEGISPQEIIDKYHNQFHESFKGIGISFDIYHRTSAELHHETSQEFFRTLHKNGEFIEEESEQYYDETAGQFLADRYIKGTCPKCGHAEAYGDQCENCGSSLSPTELGNPVSTLDRYCSRFYVKQVTGTCRSTNTKGGCVNGSNRGPLTASNSTNRRIGRITL